jgi:glycosyltransferase involved in cell wall biosynthesis
VDERPSAVERVTYLIANHNLGSYVGDCLRSLRRQTNPNWIALVLDDASTDDSLQAIAPFIDERIRLLVNERNAGYIATLKRLIAEAPTDIVAILDADDAISPDATERLLEAYGTDQRAELVYSRFATYDAGLATRKAVDGTPLADGSTAIHGGSVGAIRSFRRKAYARTAGLDETMLYAEDRDLVYKLEEVTRPVFIDAVLYCYRDVPTSQSRDPVKREIGAINTWRARRAALRRRGFSGMERVVYELFCRADYMAYSHRRPAVARALARWLATGTRLLCRRVDARRARQRQRDGVAR